MRNYLILGSFTLGLVFTVPLSASDKGSEQKTGEHAARDKWIAIDKVQHFSYSCLISLGCQYIFVNKYKKSETNSLPLSSGLSFSAGLLKELNDNRGEKGYFSIKDMVANLAGITVAAIIIIHDE